VSYGPSVAIHPVEKNKYSIFRIIGLAENFPKIFEFKGLIRKISRNKDLEWMPSPLTLAKY
jgi:hypothetical protein